MKIAKFFETKIRDGSDEKFITLTDDAPEWLQEAIREAHHESLPNDWIYEECRGAAEFYDENGNDADELHNYVDGRVDIYTNNLFQWAADFCLSNLFSAAEEDVSEISGEADIAGQIGMVQYSVINHIVVTILNACDEHDEDEN